jgi:hypothetical protein
MDRAERRQESERLRAVLMRIRDQLDVLIEHLEEDVLPPRMVAASAQQLMSNAIEGPALCHSPCTPKRGPKHTMISAGDDKALCAEGGRSALRVGD